MSSMAVEARAITANGAIANATWNTMPSYSDEVTDHTTVSSSTNGTYVMWDLTRLTKKWYAGTQGNYGVMFKAVRRCV